ncbi:MAG TPA: protein kinase [Acidobacteriota bacterium]
MIGSSLGPYEIVEQIGAGGMGEVYRARDTRLDRDVAIKVLPADVAADQDRLARFEREAKLLAQLNHANIAGIYGLEEAAGIRFIAMELVGGETLADRLERDGGIELQEALEIARQIAEALEIAHERGIVHRDLKPANIKVSSAAGRLSVKVLDFGLAKALAGEVEAKSPANSPTLSIAATRAGVILGTAAYMSPEQARGMAVDKRADIWSFGVVLFEMLSGQQLFGGETVSDTLADVLRAEIDLSQLPADRPPAVRRLLGRCLQRDPLRRLRDIGEARIVIEEVQGGDAEGEDFAADTAATAFSPVAATGATGGAGRSRASGLRGALPWLAVVGATGLLAGWIGWRLATPTADSAPIKLGFEVQGLDEVAPVISPDGRKVVFSVGDQLWVRDLGQTEPRVLPGANGARHVFWSPDSSSIGYLTSQEIFRTRADGGGNPTVLVRLPEANVAGAGGAWGSGDRIVFSRGNTGFYELSARGGDPELILEPPGVTAGDHFHEPAFLPGGELVFVVHPGGYAPDTIAVSSGGGSQEVLRIEGQRLAQPAYAPSGHLVYHRSPTLPGVWAVPYSLAERRATGEPFLVVPDGGLPSLSSRGVLAHSPGTGPSQLQLVLADRAGAVVEVLGEPQGGINRPVFSPDGTLVAWSSVAGERRGLWIHDRQRGSSAPLNVGPVPTWEPAWFPDGERIAFQRNPGTPEIAIVSSDGAGAPQTLVVFGTSPAVSPDGKHIVYDAVQIGGPGSDSISYLSVDPPGDPVTLVEAPGEQNWPVFSPDGRWVAYGSDEGGANQVYLTSFPDGVGKWQVSTEGGAFPRWNAAGDRIFFANGTDVYEVAVALEGRGPRLGRPQRLFEGAGSRLAPALGYDVDGAGERFLMVQELLGQGGSGTVVLIFNWLEEFRR